MKVMPKMDPASEGFPFIIGGTTPTRELVRARTLIQSTFVFFMKCHLLSFSVCPLVCITLLKSQLRASLCELLESLPEF